MNRFHYVFYFKMTSDFRFLKFSDLCYKAMTHFQNTDVNNKLNLEYPLLHQNLLTTLKYFPVLSIAYFYRNLELII